MDWTLDEYQEFTRTTAVYPGAGTCKLGAVDYAVLGLVGEAGELANKLKKVHRDNGGELTSTAGMDMAAELGDVCWYVARLADELDFDLSAVIRLNIEKLQSRKERGVLGGSGDTR